MLVLSRHKNERIFIGDLFITITVVSISAGKVRIGIDCPAGISVDREEVYWERKREESGGNP